LSWAFYGVGVACLAVALLRHDWILLPLSILDLLVCSLTAQVREDD
jgi:hypothetical protein